MRSGSVIRRDESLRAAGSVVGLDDVGSEGGTMNEAKNEKHPVEQIAEAVGGTITEIHHLPDGSGFACMSMPLPKTHWIYRADEGISNVPPMPFKMGREQECVFAVKDQATIPVIMSRQEVADAIREAAKYAVRASTMNGREMDFDPDAMVQNMVVGMLGYWTEDGLSGEDWGNPPRFRNK